MQRYYFLLEDFAALQSKLDALTSKIKDIGNRQGDAARQSTENMGHDDACQEAINEERKLTALRFNELKEIINRAEIVEPVGHAMNVRLGAEVELSNGRIFRIGSYLVLAEYEVENISYNSPFARVFINKRVGDVVEFGGEKIEIKAIR